MVLRVVAGQAAREAPGGLPPSGASSFVVYGTCTAYVRCTGMHGYTVRGSLESVPHTSLGAL